MVADLGVVMALFLGIVLSSLFAGEWHDNTSTLVSVSYTHLDVYKRQEQ